MVKDDSTQTPAAIAREIRHKSLRNRPCKACGRPINSLDKRQVKCGLRCPGFRTVVTCCVCGKDVERYSKAARENNCCSLECQREHALENNRGKAKPDWHKRSLRAKEKYRNERRKLRASNSVSRRFFVIANRGIQEKQEKSDWERKCATAYSMMNRRLALSYIRNIKQTTFGEVASRFDVTCGRYSRLNTWEKKCYSTAKNMKWKRRLRNVRQLSSLHIEPTKAQERQLMLWE